MGARAASKMHGSPSLSGATICLFYKKMGGLLWKFYNYYKINIINLLIKKRNTGQLRRPHKIGVN
jgi:hypothetical protein